MSNTIYAVTGASATGRVYPRLDIRDLEKKPEQFSLFIRAWLNIRNPDSRTVPVPAQHVPIAGIHGLPYQGWPGDPNGTAATNPNWKGYCNHRSVLFPTWHRPYLMLLEQSISVEAKRIVEQWKNEPNRNWGPDPVASKRAWEQAAQELRFPFWDWTAPETGVIGLPPILYQPTLSLAVTDGSRETLGTNILAFYDFGSKERLPRGFAKVTQTNPLTGDTVFTSDFDEWTRTYRWPVSFGNSSGFRVVEEYDKINNTLKQPSWFSRGSYKEVLGKVTQLFSYPLNDSRGAIIWDQFSNTRGQTKPTHNFGFTSLEQPHNTIHLVAGGTGGHMMDNDYAGFDPIFYLHHCNIDRILAFWERVYPSYWMGADGFESPTGRQQFTQVDGTYASPNDAILTETSNLEPYRKANGSYWVANDTRFVGASPFPKYYTYPPINGVSLDGPASAAQSSQGQDLRALQDHFGQRPTLARDGQKPIQQAIFRHNNEDALPEGFEPVENFRQFVIVVEVAEFAFENSHFLEVAYTFEGKTYPVGATAILSRSHGTQCAACRARQHGNSKIHDTIHIPHEIVFQIMTDHNLNNSETDDDTLLDTIRNSFKAHIVAPDGTTLAEAALGEMVREGYKAIDEAIRPKMHLASANVCAIRDKNSEILHPWQLYDWRDHRSILEDKWVVPA